MTIFDESVVVLAAIGGKICSVWAGVNFEHIYRQLVANTMRVRHPRVVLLYLQYECYLVAWRRQKLKLGHVGFAIVTHRLGGFIISEEVRIHYTRQDNTAAEAASVEAWLQYFAWRWDWAHVVAALLTAKIVLFQLRLGVYAAVAGPWHLIFERSVLGEYYLPYLWRSAVGGGWGGWNEALVAAVVDLCSLFGIFC